MFSSARLQVFVCIALGIAVSAAPAASTRASVDARSPDVYDLSGGIVGAILGLEGEGYGGDSDEDVYVLKRQLAGLDIGSRLGSNMGIAHAANLGESALAASGGVKRDVYDLGGGLAGLILGLDGENSREGSDEDVYILKRQLANLDIGSRLGSNMGIAHAASLGEGALALGSAVKRDVYDLGGGIVGAILGLEGEDRGENGDEDVYILKRQLAGLDVGTRLGSNMGLAHAATLGESALALGSAKRDVYDLGGGLAGLIFGLDGEGSGGDSEEDVYILKRQLAGLDIGSRLGSNMGIAHAANLGEGALDASSGIKRDVYDLGGGIIGAILGLEGQENGENNDEDVYILKRQLADLDVGSRLGANMGAAALSEGVLAHLDSSAGADLSLV